MSTTPLVESTLPLPLVRKGKVREVYSVDEKTLLLVTSDRISAFDVVMNEAIPKKGAVLTQISGYWFKQLDNIVPNHFVSCNTDEIVERVPVLAEHREQIAGRATLAIRTEPVPFECVVRGYITGSAWKEYEENGTLAGEALAEGLRESQELQPAIFSPATKAEEGHDENITFDRMLSEAGKEVATHLRDVSLALYEAGRERAKKNGIIIADTKFEFGRSPAGDLVLIDELLTPDSSRFWPADKYEIGRGQPSFDKQPLRDYLAGLKKAGEWNGEAPPPTLPAEVVQATSVRYQDAYLRITGEKLSENP
ncbi:MAG: phosphoribosylaminoimidazolesuccinocarboxamide synthase [Gemmatimonadota bacterium]|nr:MAG: phosphoribosylaminoimidazolesuccinocarboxamide synthase [Gemmatimonadota bacterium]